MPCPYLDVNGPKPCTIPKKIDCPKTRDDILVNLAISLFVALVFGGVFAILFPNWLMFVGILDPESNLTFQRLAIIPVTFFTGLITMTYKRRSRDD